MKKYVLVTLAILFIECRNIKESPLTKSDFENFITSYSKDLEILTSTIDTLKNGGMITSSRASSQITLVSNLDLGIKQRRTIFKKDYHLSIFMHKHSIFSVRIDSCGNISFNFHQDFHRKINYKLYQIRDKDKCSLNGDFVFLFDRFYLLKKGGEIKSYSK